MNSMMSISFHYRQTPPALRERLSVAAYDQSAVLQLLRQSDGIKEAILLNTCHRTEFYLVGDLKENWSNLLAQHLDIEASQLGSCAQLRCDQAVAHHLYRLCAGLDSMVIGESQIVHQGRWGICFWE